VTASQEKPKPHSICIRTQTHTHNKRAQVWAAVISKLCAHADRKRVRGHGWEVVLLMAGSDWRGWRHAQIIPCNLRELISWSSKYDREKFIYCNKLKLDANHRRRACVWMCMWDQGGIFSPARRWPCHCALGRELQLGRRSAALLEPYWHTLSLSFVSLNINTRLSNLLLTRHTLTPSMSAILNYRESDRLR